MKIRSLLTALVPSMWIIVSGGLGVEAVDPLPPTDLRCEFLVNPQGIDVAQPRLSWRLEWPERGQTQTAYRVLVASQPDLLAKDQGDLWDSGKVTSDQSIHVEYTGKELKSGMFCYWKVQAWDQTGRLSSWSNTPAMWSMGLLSPEDWKAKWIGLDRGEEKQAENDHRRLSARMLRREFPVEKPIARATAYVCGLGFSELYLNGRKLDSRVMDPPHSRYDKRAMYVTFDVTEYLRTGRNAAGVILGNGRFFAPRVTIPAPTPTFGFPKLLFQLRIEYVDGSSELVVSDENWKITNQGPIRANSEFDGEEYDARMEQPGWDQEGFDDSKWQPAQLVAAPGGELIAQMLEPMRVIETLKPVALLNPQPGIYVADFGQNLYGMVRIKVKGPKDTRVVIRTTFDRHPDGMVDMAPNRSALSTDIYTLKGEGVESWAARFRGQGMRFAEITGWPGVPTPDDLDMLVVHSDLEKVGDFSCSNELVNKIYANMMRTVRMQERGVPMDPDRDERQAWLSVSEKTSETEGHMFHVAAFYNSFLGECRIDQREDGCVSDAGSYWPWAYTGDPCWPAVVTTTPWSCYLMYDDQRILAENYPMMKRWVEFLETRLDPDFIYRKGTYSDWVDAYSMDKQVSDFGATSRRLALHLVQDILVEHTGHLSVGCVGMKWLMQTLTEIGRTDVAYTILTQTTRPSWGDMVSKDGTSIWERWDRDTRDPGMNGQSQTILAGYLGAWMYQTLAGIHYDPERPGFKHIILQPQPVGDLTFVKGSYKSLYGTIVSHWKIDGDTFHWHVVIPANTTATVTIPAADAATVTEGGKPANGAEGVRLLRTESQAVVYEILSGTYDFAAPGASLIRKVVPDSEVSRPEQACAVPA